MHSFDILRMKATDLELEPVVAYIRNNYTSDDLFPIVAWIVASINDDDYIFQLYKAIDQIGYDAYSNPVSRQRLFQEPLEVAMQKKRPRVEAAICESILLYSPYVMGPLHAIELACQSRNMQIVDAYIKTRGIDFIKDPEVIAIILKEDYVELMDFCIKLKLDRRMKLPDEKNLYESAVSDEMRELLDDRTAPTKI